MSELGELGWGEDEIDEHEERPDGTEDQEVDFGRRGISKADIIDSVRS